MTTNTQSVVVRDALFPAHERMPRELSFSSRLLAQMFYTNYATIGRVSNRERLALSNSLVSIQQSGDVVRQMNVDSIRDALNELRGEFLRAEWERASVIELQQRRAREQMIGRVRRLFQEAFTVPQVLGRMFRVEHQLNPEEQESPVDAVNAKIADVMQQTGGGREEAMMALLLSDKNVTEAIFIVLEQKGNSSIRADVELVRSQTEATLDRSLRVLIRNRFDIVMAIMELTVWY